MPLPISHYKTNLSLMGSVDPNHPRDVNVTVVFVDKTKQEKKNAERPR